MSYYIKELKRIINKSKLTQKEIAEKCFINSAAISKVLNEKQEPFSKEINEKICKVCNEDKRILNIARGLDLIGEDVFKILDIQKKLALQSYKIQYPEKNTDILNNLFDTDLPKFLTYYIDNWEDEILDNKDIDVLKFLEDYSNKQMPIILNDNRMEPFIPKGAKLYLDNDNEDYKKEDVVFIKKKDNAKIVGILDIRFKEYICINFYNRIYKPINIPIKDIYIIKKVKSFKYDFY